MTKKFENVKIYKTSKIEYLLQYLMSEVNSYYVDHLC